MWGWLKIRTPEDRLREAGIDWRTTWADDLIVADVSGLSRRERKRRKNLRAALRGLGRSEHNRRVQQGGNGIVNHGMGKDGRQA
jgi:hypothetical protein